MNFTLLLVVLLAATGAVWLAGWLYQRVRGRAGPERPVVVEYARSLFPVILVVLLIRSFVVEPFKIPSGSMLPTLRIGDFILVNKFEYGLRVPLLGWKLTDGDPPQRGDVIVFQYPEDESVDYIKRIVAVPGDRVAFRDHTLMVNGKPVPHSYDGQFVYQGPRGGLVHANRYQERTEHHLYHVLYTEKRSGRTITDPIRVPEGRYFVMGDNRDNSNDSRYWGTVPAQNILGEAFMIWWSWDSGDSAPRWSRLGNWVN
ncbi:signal peptidase I [Thiohalorhabdus methylotrophus]|uniref:Signal peptidase I n=1 Tax=Thiohalorhabdus methylotrophus TaxID=3242694 RepID=A0ABV4TYS3_9GAMM